MNNKRYWLRGLIAGILVYALFVFIAYFFIAYLISNGANEDNSLVMLFVIPYLSPAIPLGLLIGWMYGKMPKIAIFLSIIILVLMIGVELFMKNAFFPKPMDLQAQENKMMQGKHQVPCTGVGQPNAYTKCWEPN